MITGQKNHPEYGYYSAEESHTTDYLWEPLQRLIKGEIPEGRRIFEIGCGNGATSGMLLELGYEITAIDPSESGIKIANDTYPNGVFEVASAYDSLASSYGNFPVVFSLEVIEHCFWPRKFASTAFELTEPGGLVIISTPYHGYIKNLLLAATNKMDDHWTALWEGGHIKFWSQKTLKRLLEETGFSEVSFLRVGRIGPVAKSMIALARKPVLKQEVGKAG